MLFLDIVPLKTGYDEKNRVAKNISRVGDASVTTEYLYGEVSKDQIPDAVYGVRIDGEDLLSYSYDGLGRLRTKALDLETDYELCYSYEWGEEWNATPLARQLVEKGESFLHAWNYEYDALGNITEVRLGTEVKLHYTYDALSQLVRVDDAFEGKTHTYAYDAGGNILSHGIYPYTRAEDPGTAETTISYGYADSGWKDQLTSYNGETFTYDGVGNPLTWRDGMTLTWKHGRQLESLTKEGQTHTYRYDEEGYRISRQTGDTVTTYYRSGELLLTEITGEERLDFLYDADFQLLGFKENGTNYYYRKNLQGDITGILDETGSLVVSYGYDAWGRPISCTGSLAETVGQKNPFRYRGYYYDAESGLYYLNSRYYDPEVGRFISADGYVSTGKGVTGYNMYSYCLNNPVNMLDYSGEIPWYYLPDSAKSAYVRPKAQYDIHYNKTVVIYDEKIEPSNVVKNNSNNIYIFDYRKGSDNPDVRIQNSYKIVNSIQQIEVLKVLLDYNEIYPSDIPWNRTIDSMMIEWDAHNHIYVLYNNERCKHVDLDNNDEGVTYYEYWKRAFEAVLFQ